MAQKRTSLSNPQLTIDIHDRMNLGARQSGASRTDAFKAIFH
jgi:hypothetical protein